MMYVHISLQELQIHFFFR